MKKELVRRLIDIGAINVNFDKPYTFASGLVSPIYCDNRKILSYVDVRRYVKKELIYSVLSNFENIEVIAGVSTSGIPFGLMVAEGLDLPFVYVRIMLFNYEKRSKEKRRVYYLHR
jgi:orotate phosphoribosyltransferase